MDSGKTTSDLRFLYLSPASRHALLGMRVLAQMNGGAGFHLAEESARRGKLPKNSLAKIFQRLAHHGLLISQRGPGGGYALARTPATISLAEILRAVQDIVPGGRHCLLANRRCDESAPCLIHALILRADRSIIDGLEELTLEDLARSTGWD